MTTRNGEAAADAFLYLRSERLTVALARPGAVYQGSRFDWTGFITQVTLDGRHTFCVAEALPPDKGTGGAGLCNEFGIFAPVGYDEAEPGEQFPKLGVGLLTRPDVEPYSFARPYALEPFPMRVTVTGPASAQIVVEPLPCRGYAARLAKTVTVAGNSLQIEYRLANVGSRPLVTHEYCHNFLAIDGQPLGPAYRLRFPYEIVLAEAPEPLTVEGREIGWRQAPSGAFYCRLGGFSPARPGHCWELVHTPSGIGVCEEDDFPVSMVALWGTTHVVSPEVFVAIALEPGAVQGWRRRYEFWGPDGEGLGRNRQCR